MERSDVQKLVDDKPNEITAIPELLDDVKLYFEDSELLAGCAYVRVAEKARGGLEVREYWQTDDIQWLTQKKQWAGLSSIAMTRRTVTKNGAMTAETRYFISSLPLDAGLVARAIRGHWMVESYHWHLDVTFREDAGLTLDKAAAYNLNIVRKMAINTLKPLDVGIIGIKGLSLRAKRYMISLNPINLYREGSGDLGSILILSHLKKCPGLGFCLY